MDTGGGTSIKGQCRAAGLVAGTQRAMGAWRCASLGDIPREAARDVESRLVSLAPLRSGGGGRIVADAPPRRQRPSRAWAPLAAAAAGLRASQRGRRRCIVAADGGEDRSSDLARGEGRGGAGREVHPAARLLDSLGRQAQENARKLIEGAAEGVLCSPLLATIAAAARAGAAAQPVLARMGGQMQAVPPPLPASGHDAELFGGSKRGEFGDVESFGEDSMLNDGRKVDGGGGGGGGDDRGGKHESKAPPSPPPAQPAGDPAGPPSDLAGPPTPPPFVVEMFAEMDEEGTGVITTENLVPFLERLGLPTTDDYVSELLEQFNRGESHPTQVHLDKLAKYAVKKEKHFKRIFDSMDIKKTGVITEGEMQAVMTRVGQTVSEVDSAKMVHLLDKECNGVITYDEFRRYAILLPVHQLRENSALCIMESAVKPEKAVAARNSQFYQLFAGGCAGMVAKTMVAPLERVRTMMMAEARKGNTGIISSLRGIFKDEGVRGLFRGNSATLMKIVPASSIQFAVFAQMKGILLERRRAKEGQHVTSNTPGEQLLAGSVSGAMVCVTTYPLETIKTNMSVAGGIKAGVLQAGWQIVRSEGAMGLYKGFYGAVLNDVLGNGLGFMAYGIGNKMLARHNGGRRPATWQKGLLGGMSACLVLTVTLPFEVMQKRMQVQGSCGRPVLYTGTWNAFKTITKDEGFGAFYAGAMSSYLKVAPSIAATYFIYELLVRELGIGGLRQYKMKD